MARLAAPQLTSLPIPVHLFIIHAISMYTLLLVIFAFHFLSSPDRPTLHIFLSLCRFIANNDEWIHMNSYYTQEHSPSQGAQREVDHLHIWCTFDENTEYLVSAGGEFKIGNSNRNIVVVQLFLLLFIRLQFCKWFTSMTFPLFTEMTCSDGTWYSWLLETMMHSARYEMTDEQDKKLERNFPSSLFLFLFHSLPHTVLSSNTTRFFSLATN